MRLIDADALLAEIKNPNQFVEVLAWVKDAPTIDAVQVVRCGDCEHMDYCTWHGCKKDDYCSYGMRKDKSDETD